MEALPGAEERAPEHTRRLPRAWGVYCLGAIVVLMIIWPNLWPLSLFTPALLLGADPDFMEDPRAEDPRLARIGVALDSPPRVHRLDADHASRPAAAMQPKRTR